MMRKELDIQSQISESVIPFDPSEYAREIHLTKAYAISKWFFGFLSIAIGIFLYNFWEILPSSLYHQVFFWIMILTWLTIVGLGILGICYYRMREVYKKPLCPTCGKRMAYYLATKKYYCKKCKDYKTL